jgi:dipeptidase E
MKQLFLTSSVNRVATHIAKQLDLTQGNKLAFIDTAAEVEPGDKKWLANDRQALVEAGFGVFDYTLTNKTETELRTDLSSADFLYLSGGNTYYLLEKAQQSGFIKVVRDLVLNQGKVYISTSAGSIIAGPDTEPAKRLDKLEAAPDLQGFAGFNLVPFCIFPHWGSETFKSLYLNYRLDHAYKKDQVPLVLLTDTQYLKVVDEHVEFIETR